MPTSFCLQTRHEIWLSQVSIRHKTSMSAVMRELIEQEIKTPRLFPESDLSAEKIEDRVEEEQNYLKENFEFFRRYVGIKENIPYWWVFSNEMIDRFIVSYPKTLNQLAKISGMGKRRVKKYGEGILTILADYRHKKLAEECENESDEA